ncbi:hypothetical protein CPB84DRAFT_1754877 [Gymnopilus junonius]|uniref:Uncharacterized protein n=1 Tax=Gymnopilus junonius TaxID=109634 RepID=A0A9P5TEJ2_GYMJU|nr:hypothetical protein CPB84DRAFT_1754877 [Gymnopilus junonius]
MDPPPTLPSEVLYRITNAIDGTCPEGRQSLLAFHVQIAHSVLYAKKDLPDVEISYTARSSEDAGIILLDDEATTGHKFLDLLPARRIFVLHSSQTRPSCLSRPAFFHVSNSTSPPLDTDMTEKSQSEREKSNYAFLSLIFSVSVTDFSPLYRTNPNLGLLRNLRHLTIRTRMWGKEQSNQESNYDLLYIASALKPCRSRVSIQSSLGLLPWIDLITVLEDDQVAPCIAGVKLKFQLHGHNDAGELVQIDVPFSSLKDILDKNMGFEGTKGERDTFIWLLFNYNS